MIRIKHEKMVYYKQVCDKVKSYPWPPHYIITASSDGSRPVRRSRHSGIHWHIQSKVRGVCCHSRRASLAVVEGRQIPGCPNHSGWCWVGPTDRGRVGVADPFPFLPDTCSCRMNVDILSVTAVVFIKALLKAPQGWHAVTYGFQLDALTIYLCLMLHEILKPPTQVLRFFLSGSISGLACIQAS